MRLLPWQEADRALGGWGGQQATFHLALEMNPSCLLTRAIGSVEFARPCPSFLQEAEFRRLALATPVAAQAGNERQ